MIKELEKVQEKLAEKMVDDDPAIMKQYSDVNRVINAYEAYEEAQKILPEHRISVSPLAQAYDRVSERLERINEMALEGTETDKLSEMAINSLEKIKECLYNEAIGNKKEGLALINSKDLAILAVHDLIAENPLSPQVEVIESVSAEEYINKVSEHDVLKNNAKKITAQSLNGMLAKKAGFTDALEEHQNVKEDGNPKQEHIAIPNKNNLVH